MTSLEKMLRGIDSDRKPVPMPYDAYSYLAIYLTGEYSSIDSGALSTFCSKFIFSCSNCPLQIATGEVRATGVVSRGACSRLHDLEDMGELEILHSILRLSWIS